MKRLKIIFYIVVILVVIISKGFAQARPENTSSAKAYYGTRPGKPSMKAGKTKKIKNYTHTRPAKGTQATGRTTRRKYLHSWAS
jgi:hypothetical protein